MMKLMNRIMVVVMMLSAILACSGSKDEKPLDITGEWNLIDVTMRSATLGGQTVDVYVSFSDDRTFTIYQMIGEGRYRKYTGSWTIVGNTLDGKYSDGKKWGATYDVELTSSGSRMILSTSSGEIDIYQKVSIPTEIIDNAILMD